MRTPTLFLALTLALTACGGATDPASMNDAGAKALNSGDYAGAATQFDAALTAIGDDTANAQYQRAMWGFIEAGAHVDPARAKDDFLAFAKANSATMSAKEYSKVGTWLSSAGAYTEAVFVVDAGIQAYPETPALLAMIENIKADAAKAGDADAASALEGLGYLGDD